MSQQLAAEFHEDDVRDLEDAVLKDLEMPLHQASLAQEINKLNVERYRSLIWQESGLLQTGGQYSEDCTFDFEVGIFTAQNVTHQAAFFRLMQCRLKFAAFVNEKIFLPDIRCLTEENGIGGLKKSEFMV
ncbi:hypothetical protein BGZ59_010320 [Podila verticillata]|nr:hypothetical protein BGZ59_010320 [Podila verticillata]